MSQPLSVTKILIPGRSGAQDHGDCPGALCSALLPEATSDDLFSSSPAAGCLKLFNLSNTIHTVVETRPLFAAISSAQRLTIDFTSDFTSDSTLFERFASLLRTPPFQLFYLVVLL
eukprot:IDg17981t1